MKNACLALTAVLFVSACTKNQTAPVAPTPPAPPQLTAPALDAPSDDLQLSTLRPELTVVNGTSSQPAGTRTYEFQIADNDIVFAGGRYRRQASPKTPAARPASPHSRICSRRRGCIGARGWCRTRPTPTGRRSASSRRRLVGFNRPGELYDPLVHGETMGTTVGNFSFVPGQGHPLERHLSPTCAISCRRRCRAANSRWKSKGCGPDGPGGKPKVFQMMDSPDCLPSRSLSMINAQYRGRPGNPDHSVAFKAVLGSLSDARRGRTGLAKRNQSVLMLDPSRTYFWQGIWDAAFVPPRRPRRRH